MSKANIALPETIRYRLKPDNLILRIIADFTKNPVGIYDDTTLCLEILPQVNFPYPVEKMELSFSENSFNKTIVPKASFASGEKQKHEELLYIKPGYTGFVILQTITITMKTPKGTIISFILTPSLPEAITFSFNTMISHKLPQLHILNTERVIETSISHTQPAFLGEQYPVNISVKQIDTYEVSNLLITFCEIIDEEKQQKTHVDRKASRKNSRKASIVSVDSADSPDWSYALYLEKIEKNESGAEISNITKLPHHHHTISSFNGRQENIKFFMQFREEGRKNFELIYRYTGKKTFKDGTTSTEFTLENREYFFVDVLCPFVLSSEWITPEPCMSCANTQFYQSGQAKTHLGIGKKALLGAKISTGSHPKVKIHDVKLKVKDDGTIKLIEDCTIQDSKWQGWPIVLGISESLSATFSVLPLVSFNDQQIADIEILWSRATEKESEKTVCAIPLPQVTATDSCVDVIMTSIPTKAVKFKEFFVTYELKNTTGAVIETKLSMDESPHFFISGEISTKITLPPYVTDEIKFGLTPLRCGKFDLPSMTISMIAGGSCEPIIDGHFKHAIYVFPA